MRGRGTLRNRQNAKGFTLLEVVVAAGLLGAFTVVGARPIQQALMAANVAADRAAAVRFAASGIELARSRPIENWESGRADMGIPAAEVSTYYDEARKIRLTRSITAAPTVVSPSDQRETWTWTITSTVTWERDGRRAGDGAKVVLISRQSRWLIPGNKDESRSSTGKVKS